jgi:hypothetical protein
MYDALRDLKRSLDRVREITSDIDAQAPQALANHALAKRLETIRCSLIIIITGFFESFLRDTAEAFITNVNSRGIPYASLPVKLRVTNLQEGGRALMQRVRDEKNARATWMTASSEDIANRLGSITSATACELVWEAFAQTRANPNFQVVKEFLGNFGITNPGPALAAATGLSHQGMETQLASLLSMRNESAHSGQPTIVPAPSTIRDSCDLLETMAAGIVELLNQYLRENTFLPHCIRL